MSNFLKAMLILSAGAVTGVIIGLRGGSVSFVFLAAGALALGILILTRPYLGIIATVAAVPLESLYPDSPFGTSLLSLLGLLTLVSFLVKNRFAIRARAGSSLIYRFAFLFILWLFITNPIAAMSGARNWVFTYLQLIVLLWLAAEEITLERQRMLMVVFIAVTSFSVVQSFGEATLTNTIYRSTRADGLVDNSNMFAAYLNVAIAFTLYFIVSPRIHRLLQICMVAILALLILGVALSISRSGAIALGFVLISGLVLYSRLSAETTTKNRFRNFTVLMGLAFAIYVIASVLIPPQYWSILAEARTMIEQGTEATEGTFGIRLELWQDAITLWRTSPVWGIGAGQFVKIVGHVTHNIYFQVLAEQGLIGLVILMAWLGNIFWTLIRTMIGSEDKEKVALAATWMLALIAICVMGLSGSWHLYSKILWLAAGVSTVFIVPKKKMTSAEILQAHQFAATKT